MGAITVAAHDQITDSWPNNTSDRAADFVAMLNAIKTGGITALTVSGALASTTLASSGNFAVNTNKFNVTAASGNTTVAGTLGVTGAITPTGGVAAGAGGSFSPRLCHTGGVPPVVSTDMGDGTPSVTETYCAEVFIPANCSVTGIAVFNGSATGSGNITVYLADAAGNQLANSASTALSGTDAYQLVPFTPGAYAAKGPATYYVLVQYNNTGTHFNFHVIGSFGAGKLTGTTYGTYPTTPTMPTTFTTVQGPVASLY